MRKINEKATIVRGYELRTGERFKLINGDIVWTVIDDDPQGYSNYFRAAWRRGDLAFSKNQKYLLVKLETK